MTADLLALVAGAVLSLAFSYIPGLNTKFTLLDPEKKRLIMLGLLAVVAVAVYGVSCLQWWDIGITCDTAGIKALVEAFILAMIANQSAYAITPQTAHIRALKVQ